MATLTYVYSDSTAVLGPLATYAEPHCYDLCPAHASRLTVPRGWSVLRLDIPAAPRLAVDDLSALADAVSEREEHDVTAPGAASTAPQPAPEPAVDDSPRRTLTPPEGAEGTPKPGDKPKLRILRDPNQ